MTESPDPATDPTRPVAPQSWWRQPVPPDGVVRLLEIVALAIICGAGGGLLEGVILLFRRFVLHQFINTSPMVVWMAPLAYLFLFAVFGGAVFLLRLFTRQIGLQTVAAVFGSWGAFRLVALLLDMQLHPYAILLLALGGGVVLGRIVIRPGVRQLLVPVAAVLLAITGALTVGMPRAEEWLEARAIGRLPDPRSGAPNVLLIILDTVRGESLSLHGYQRPTTPHIDEWAAEGTLFDRAIAPAPWTLPTHMTLFTGHLPHETRANWLTPFQEGFLTLAEAFRGEGYLTGALVANLGYTTSETGLLRGFAHRDHFAVSRAQLKLSTELFQARIRRKTGRNSRRYPARKNYRTTIDSFLRWLDSAPDRPFFVFVNLFDAHAPYYATADLRRAFADSSHRGTTLRRESGSQQRAPGNGPQRHATTSMRALPA